MINPWVSSAFIDVKFFEIGPESMGVWTFVNFQNIKKYSLDIFMKIQKIEFLKNS